MSTEARRASIPPRPTTPPRPSTPLDEPVETAPNRMSSAPHDSSRLRDRAPGSIPARPERPPTAGSAPGPEAPAPQAPSTGASSFPAQAEQPPRPGTPSQPAAPLRPGRTSVRMGPSRPEQPPMGWGTPPPAAADGTPDRPGPGASPARPGTSGPAHRPGANSDSPSGGSGDPAPASGSDPDGGATRTPGSARFPNLRLDRNTRPAGPPPPAASARFPDAPPTAGVPPQRTRRPTEGIVETTARLQHPQEETGPASPTRPFVSFAEPDTRDLDTRRRLLFGGRVHPHTAAAAAACLVLGLGLIGGAVTGSWLTSDGSGEGVQGAFAVAGSLWHSVPVDQLFPPTVNGPGAGPGGADRTWTRIGVAQDGTCKDAFDPLLRKALAPVGCLRLLRATYTDATQSHVTTVGLLFTRADAAAMSAARSRFKKEGLARRTDLMPRPYAAKGTVAERFGDAQRASWTVSVLADIPVVVYAVSGFADGRTVSEPQPAVQAMQTGATTAPAQAGLGNEATGLAEQVEVLLRKTVTSATGKPS
ncbi:hypothetical protein ACWGQ5_05925 [Streptomyces sp. NPDC055722]